MDALAFVRAFHQSGCQLGEVVLACNTPLQQGCIMAKHSISDAARIAGKSRTTLHRHIKSGKLSKSLDDNGFPVVDTSELQRVYGTLSQLDSTDTASVEQPETPPKIATLQMELDALRRENDNLRNERDRWASQAESLTRLITHQEPERRRSWLGRLLSGH